ncbi:MAG TPA: pitrilysin family protein [Candidatus Limnocylindrales bacterium]|nr:pitrilysin family protein [Candidatus Limnocylindrales bacterium]
MSARAPGAAGARAAAVTVPRARAATALRVSLTLLTAPLTPLGALDLTAQELPHPTAMELPDPASPRPDPDGLRVTLPGGLTAYVVPDPTVPLVTVAAFVDVGWADGAPGAAHALAAILRRRGPADLGSDAFQASLRRMAADWRVLLGPEELEVTIDVPAADAPEAIRLLGETLTRPDLASADVVALARGAARPSPSAAASGESGPVLYEGSLDAAVAMFQEHLLEGHRYAPSITPAEAEALEVAKVEELHRSFVRTGNVVLAVSGDIDRAEAVDLVRGAFADLPTGAAPERPAAEALPPLEARVAHIQDVDKLQGWVVMGHALDPVPLEDEAALLVMNYILGGGHFDTRLFGEVRDKRGLANTAGGFPEWRRHGPGSYTLRTYGRPETIPLLVQILQDEAVRIRSEPVSDEEVAVAKGALADGEFAMGFHDGAATARTFAREWLHEGGHEASATFQARVAAVTAAHVQDVATRYLHPDGFRMVVIGPLARIRDHTPLEGEPPLDAFGRVVEGPGGG